MIQKRKFRDVDDSTKMRISQKLKGRSFSDSHKKEGVSKVRFLAHSFFFMQLSSLF